MHLVWWRKDEATAVDAVRDLAEDDPLVTAFGDGQVVVALSLRDDGWLASWTVGIAPRRSLGEVELFIAKVATFIIDEPIE